jgi:DNA-directed RNA polymerase specialized sigma24 family protein
MSPNISDLLSALPAARDENDEFRNRSALWALWEEHHLRLRRLVASRSCRSVDDHDVHNAASDALLRLGRTRRTGTVPDDVSGWLALVAWREFLRRTGREGRRRRVEQVMFVRAERVTAARSPEGIAVARSGQEAQRQALEMAMRMLTRGQRESMELFAEGASYDEIAVARSSTHRAVSRALGKARGHLRRNGHLSREVREWAA